VLMTSEHKLLMTAFKDKESANRYRKDITSVNSDDVEVFFLPYSEFYYLDSQNLIAEINNAHNLMIDEYESETIDSSIIDSILELLSVHKLYVPVFIKALTTALNNESSLELDF
ncbi:MAG: hypothetical protein ACI4Q4_03250, partial [Oscillospiraceae bacterium]